MELFVAVAAVAGAMADPPHPSAFCIIKNQNEASLLYRISSGYISYKKLKPARLKHRRSQQ